MTKRFALAGVASFLSAIGGAAAQSAAPNPQPQLSAPAVAEFAQPSGVRSMPPPPANFDPLTASPQALAQYALPPAPDRVRTPRAFAAWQSAVSIHSRRNGTLALTNQAANPPVLTSTMIYNRPLQRAAQPAAAAVKNGTTLTSSSNWSGSSVLNFKNPSNQAVILAEFTVPTARQALFTCTGGWDYSSLWPGIDGNGSSDVLQAGVEADAYCSGGSTQSFYSAWIEWYPNYETRVSAPTLNAGDLILVEVWNTSPTVGYAYIANLSTRQAASYYLPAPSGTGLAGNSVEWIVERPGIGSGSSTLTNYVGSSWIYGVAYGVSASPTYYFPGVSAGDASTFELITMLDNNNQGISSATAETQSFLYFQDYGSACSSYGISQPC